MSKNPIHFAIVALAAAGFAGASKGVAADETTHVNNGLLDGVKAIVENLNKEHTYTLAQHQSHASHGSHGSHSSHRSYYKPPEPEDDRVDNQGTGIQLATARNDRSTPNNSVLPSTPAITKLKVLKGNSEKFGKIVSAAQIALIARGYDVTSVDGALDARTMAAIYKFQEANGMNPDGRVTPQVLTALNIAAN